MRPSLLIYKTGTEIPEAHPGDVVESLDEIRSWVTSGYFLSRLFYFQNVELYCYRGNLVRYPFLVGSVMWLLSRGKKLFRGADGEVVSVTIAKLLVWFCQYLLGMVSAPITILKTGKKLAELEVLLRNKVGKKLKKNAPPLYLRADLVFGVKSGGSLGHIAGVLNNLKQFCPSPLFFSTDVIATVDKKIYTEIIWPAGKFIGIHELEDLNFNNLCIRKICKQLNGTSPSFVYQRYSLNNFSGVALSARYNIPFVLEYNGSDVWIARNWGRPLRYEKIAKRIEMLNLNYADVIVVVSRPLKDELMNLGIEEEKILVNPNGVDPVRYSPNVDGTEIRSKFKMEAQKVIGFIGTFGKWHGAEVLVAAYGKLLQEHGEYRGKVKLFMIGDGITMPLVKKEIEHYGIQDDCILTGLVPQEKGPGYLAACDLLVAPHVPNADGTPFFGSPTKLFEYMAMGKGIVASDLDQIGEVLDHGQTAWLVKPGDKNDLAEGLRILIDDEQLCADLGNNARAQAENNYTWEKHTERIIDKLRTRCS